MIQGNNVIIKLNGTAILYSKSCTISHDCETQEISSPSAGMYRQYIARRKTWKVSVNYLIGSTIKEGLLRVGNAYTLSAQARNSSADSVSGTVICTKCSVNGTTGNLATGQFEFMGVSALS